MKLNLRLTPTLPPRSLVFLFLLILAYLTGISASFKPFRCPSTGLFGDPDDCGRYFECRHIQDGLFLFWPQNCEKGEEFNVKTQEVRRI